MKILKILKILIQIGLIGVIASSLYLLNDYKKNAYHLGVQHTIQGILYSIELDGSVGIKQGDNQMILIPKPEYLNLEEPSLGEEGLGD